MTAAPDDGPAQTDDTPEAQNAVAPEAPTPAPPPEYAHDDSHVQVAVAVLDETFANLSEDSPDGWGLVDAALTGRDDVDPALARELCLIAARDLDVADAGDAGCEFVRDGAWLPDPKDVSTEVVKLWRACAAEVTDPSAVARVEELLIARRDGKVGERARRAATAYLATTSTGPVTYQTMLHLARAWTISRRYQLPDLEDAALDQVAQRVGLAQLGEPGIWLPLLAMMCRHPTNVERRDVLHAKAREILTRYASASTTEHIVAEVGALRRSLIPSGPDAEELRRDTRRDELTALRRAAEAPGLQPMVRQHHLATAAEFATRHAFWTEKKEIQADLESINFEDLGLEHFSHTSEVPRWIPEAEIRRVSRWRSWQLGLDYFLHTVPPTGDVESLRESAGQSRGVLRSIITTVVLGHRGLPRMQLSGPEEELAHDMSQASQVMARHVGAVHGVGLQQLAERHGIPAEGELRDYFVQTYNCDPGAALILAKAFRLFWRGEYIEATHLVTPTVEAAARRLLRELDEGVYQVQLGNTPGQYPGLHTLLEELDKLGLDPSWSWFIRWLLLGPTGMNIRNDVAHGFFLGDDMAYTVLVLRAASLLVTASTSNVDEQRSIHMLVPAGPRPGVRGIGDRLLDAASSALLRGHAGLESIRARLGADHRG